MRKKKTAREATPTAVPYFHIEADRVGKGISVVINGVREILDFSEERIRITLKIGGICLEGRGLTLSLFENGTVEIYGKITLWEFLYGKA